MVRRLHEPRRLHPCHARAVSRSAVEDPRLPPRWFVRAAWHVHRAIYRLTRGRLGLWRPSDTRWGAMRLTVTGRRSGQPRSVILGYYEDGPNLVTMAMNGWADGEPAWWLNLRSAPVATVEVRGRTSTVQAHAAVGAERDRLWERWRLLDDRLDDLAALRSTETAVVVLEPATSP
jgi:F420H(2)-dependent quinone reductase